RHAEKTLAKFVKGFGAVLVTGARQVGKTTLLREFGKDMHYVTLDNPVVLQAATHEGGTFFKQHKSPLIIDEIQYAPGLFPYIKMMIDNEKRKGLVLMSGSQQFRMMKNVSESLAGRLAILNLPDFSLREIQHIQFDKPFLPVPKYFSARSKHLQPLDYDEVWRIIQRGSMPALNSGQDIERNDFYSTYTKTYIERDVRDLTQVGDERLFLQFLTVAAGRTGNLLNLSSLANDVGISVSTAERWLSILIASNIVYVLRPFFVNVTKRMVKTPKIYFLDTGLAAFLTGWDTPQTLSTGAVAGAFFETFVVSQIIKSYANAGIDPPLYFYRDRDGKEIDLVLWQNGLLHPLEIKKHANPSPGDITAFAALEKIQDFKRGSGGVICMYEDMLPLKGEDMIIPLNYI
ncbi:MAG: ATP-binding protein, partial [Spirochaetales bacterium]|nr:ATP-binding protein [Spirochaetales bacterium]